MKRYMLTLPALLLLAGCADTPMGPALQGDPPAGASFARLGDSEAGPALAETQSIVIDFEALASSGNDFTYIASWSEDGFTVADPSSSDGYTFGAPQTGNTGFFQGSTALVNNWPGDATVLTKDDGGEFDATSIDIAELRTTDTAPIEITFTGIRADATTVSATLTTDGAAGFETFALAGFTGLTSLSWIQVAPYYQFDNITLAVQSADPPPDDPPDDPPPDDPPPDDPPSADLPSGPVSKADCMNGGWRELGFKNQGLCIRMVETGKDKR
jgi:hypothetical protein